MSLNSTWCLTRSDRKHAFVPFKLLVCLVGLYGEYFALCLCKYLVEVPRSVHRPREKYPPYRLPARLIRILEIRISQISPHPGVQSQSKGLYRV